MWRAAELVDAANDQQTLGRFDLQAVPRLHVSKLSSTATHGFVKLYERVE